ncbi:aftiphilin isoform X2 [Ascaphus truei]|uniref:aftiphilin isoform X2 n=1 Tax=Ascaphus truei TaxID=8439 RepID=UPI003F5AD2AD
MEPDVVRMYSSSPPPLDSVADDDEDDEFGEFGGFSGVSNSGIGFDGVKYPNSRDDFIPSKHFMPIHEYSDNVNNFTSLTSIKDKENFSELPTKKGPSSVLETNTSNETIQFVNAAALDNKGNSGEKVKKTEIYVKSEGSVTCVDSTELNRSKDQAVGTCNGEKVHCLENLTNGFAVVDSVNPQGIEDLDSISDSKGFKTISIHSAELNIDFTPSPGKDFADFATVSTTDTAILEDTELKAHERLYEGQTRSIRGNNELNGIDEINSTKQVFVDLVPENSDGPNDLPVRNCSSETNVVVIDSVEDYKAASTSEFDISACVTMQSDIWASVDTDGTIGELTERVHSGETNEEETSQTIDEIGCSTNDKCFKTLAGTKNIKHSSNGETDYTNNAFDGSSSVMKNSSGEYVSPDHRPNEFGDLDASEDPPLTNHNESNNIFKEPLEQNANINELSDDFGDFKDTNIASFKEEIKQTSNERLKFQGFGDKYSEVGPCEEPEEFNEFEDFSSLPQFDESSTFQDTDDFADFSSAGLVNQASDWKAFEDSQVEGSTWAAFVDEKTANSLPDSEAWQSHRTDVPPTSGDQIINTDSVALPAFHESESALVSEESTYAFQQSLLSRLERIIQVCFPPPHPVAEIDENVSPLDHMLETEKCERTSKSLSTAREVLDMWTELQDIHDAYGLKYQWGGSHSNKKLLCSLGIDTRNILFTGNKKQPVIVPMYAAGLGMLEPTKEPLKPLSAAEKITSIGQASPVCPDESICTSDQFQESLPPVQFDWSSSGLTNPLDGVDPELYELTTSKLECSSSSSKVTDAFARLMSTAETTSTSARKPRRDENLSEESAKVIASLPDLSFMHAKVLMFPATLTPSTSSQDHVH